MNIFSSSRNASRFHRSRSRVGALCLCLLTLLAAPAESQVRFEDVTQGSGVEYAGESYGASWGYANDDPLPDLFVSHHRNTPGLYINLGDGTFENRAFEVDAWQITPWSDTHGGSFADYDNDGLNDLMITAGSKNATQFLINNGVFLTDRIQDFTFDRVSWGARLPVWFDFNNDGLLDLAVAVQNAKFQLHERVGADFERRNSASGHQCEDHDYAHLSDWTFDGRVDWLCVSHDAGPEYLYDISVGMPFPDLSALANPAVNVNDSAVADFDGDLVMDLFAVRGKVRINGAEIVGGNTVEAHLTNSGDSDAGMTFQSAGDLAVELHWSGPNVSRIFIGAGGLHPPPAPPDEPITFTLRAADPNVHGIQAYDPAVDRGIYVGYDPATQTWSWFNSAGGGTFSYTYTYLQSTMPVSNLEVLGLRSPEEPTKPALLRYTSGTFSDQVAGTGLDHNVLCNAVAAFDADNDMDVDLYYVCRGAISNLANRLYLNDGTGVFTPAAAPHGAEGPVGPGTGLGENVVASDYDVDGFVDLFVTNGLKLYPALPGYGAGGPDKLFRNTSGDIGNTNNWLQIDLTGVTSNRDGLGATVTVLAGGVTQRREQNGGYHRWAQHDQRLHFGLAANETADIEVRWPSGQLDTYFGVAANSVYEVVEGSPNIEPVTIPDTVPPTGCSPAANAPAYDPGVDQALLLWKDNCTSQNWKLRVIGGVEPATRFSGAVQSQLPYESVSGVLLEPSDSLDFATNPTRIEYDLGVGAGGEDGIDFTVDEASGTCFGLNSSVTVAYVGSGMTPVSVPFDLDTLEPCVDSGVRVSVDDVSIDENDPAGRVVFTVSLDAASAENISVDYATTDGTAMAMEDYNPVADSLTFLAGEQTATVTVDILDDTVPEAAETFSLILSNPVNVQLGNATGTATIFDNELSSCGMPVYDLESEQAAFVWQDCDNGTWSVRTTGGGQSAITFIGALDSSEPFTALSAVGLESSDILDTSDPEQVAFELIVSGPRQDGFDASVTSSAALCFELTSPAVPVYVGANRLQPAMPFDPRTLGPCRVPEETDLVTVLSLATGDSTPAELDVVRFDVTVTNDGPLEATSVQLAALLPPGLTATANNGLVSAGVYDGQTWSIGTLPVAATATLTLEGVVDVGQPGVAITSTITAAEGDQPDPTPDGDELSVTVVVDPGALGADLRTVKTLATADPNPAEGEVVGFSIMVTNAGPAEATAVSLRDTLPAGLAPTLNNGVVSQGSYDGTTWNIGTLPPASSATLTLEGSVEIGFAGTTIINTTTAAAGDQPDIYTVGDDLTESVIVDGARDIPLVDWLSPSGGVSVAGNHLSYSGVPTGWSSNSVNSVPFSSLGIFGNYSVRWTIASDPTATIWVVGLGVTESSRNWRDVDYALRSSEGELKIYQNGVWRSSSAALAVGDELEIYVKGTTIGYRLNGSTIYTTSIQGTEDFYIDTSFRQGAIDLASFTLVNN